MGFETYLYIFLDFEKAYGKIPKNKIKIDQQWIEIVKQ